MYFSGPSGEPLNIAVKKVTNTSAEVTWSQPEIGKRNGIIKNFNVYVGHEHLKDISASDTNIYSVSNL